METPHEKGPVRHLTGKLDHAGPGCQQIDGRRCRTSVSQARRRRTERDALPGEELSQLADRLAHGRHPCTRLSPAPRRNEARRHSEEGPPRCNLVQAVRARSENERMANQRTRGRRKQLQALRCPARERKREISVPPT